MRHSVNKRASARKFRKGAAKSRPVNRAIARGGYRL